MAEGMALGWIAYWHNLSWLVRPAVIGEGGLISHGLIERLDNLKLDYSLKTAKVKTKKSEGEKSKVVESTLESNDVTFETTYKAATGTKDINTKLNDLKDLIGYAAPLVIANYNSPMIWGSFYMQLTKIATSGVKMDEVGRIYEAKVSFTLSEAKDKKIKKQAVTYPAGSTSEILNQFTKQGKVPEEYKSALKICPDKSIKALLKGKKKKK